MTPTFVEDARGVLVLGTPGGSRIVSQMLLAVLDHLNRAPDPARSVAVPRFHAQAGPNRIEVEPEGFDPMLLEDLRERGHEVVDIGRRWGAMQAVWVNAEGCAQAASDPRGLMGARPVAACSAP
jgi:gamma-glutamyltranspeptidase/glutathione hydrolase